MLLLKGEFRTITHIRLSVYVHSVVGGPVTRTGGSSSTSTVMANVEVGPPSSGPGGSGSRPYGARAEPFWAVL